MIGKLKEYPLRIEIGPRDLENEKITIYRRDTGEKFQLKEQELKGEINNILNDIINNMKENAKNKIESFISVIEYKEDDSLENLINTIREKLEKKGGMILISFNSEIYNEDFEENIGGSILGITEYNGKEYIAIGRTY